MSNLLGQESWGGFLRGRKGLLLDFELCLTTQRGLLFPVLIDLGWVNEDTLATCLSLAFSHGAGPRSPKGSKRGQAPICNHFSTSDSVTFATVSLAEVRDVAQLGVGVEGDYSRVQRIMTILQTIPFRA